MPQQPLELDHRGMKIRGMTYLPDGGGRHPAALLMHGFTGQRMESGFLFVRLGRALAEAGVAAVTFDFLNSGESDGSFEQMLVTQELADAMKMTQWLAGQPFVDRSRLGLLGFSLGGLLAGCVLGRTEVYKAAVMLAPTTEKNVSRHAKRESTCDAAGESVRLGPHCLNPRFFDDVATLSPVADCVRYRGPVLVVQGGGDEAVPPDVSAEFVEARRVAGAAVELRLIDDADHAFSRPAWRHELIQKVVGWLGERL